MMIFKGGVVFHRGRRWSLRGGRTARSGNLWWTANYPSVCMWSMGNEVRHAGGLDVWRQLNAQVGLSSSSQRRPISNFSGAAGWGSYGRDPLDTDVLDLHTYVALSNPWTQRDRQSNSIYQGLLEI